MNIKKFRIPSSWDIQRVLNVQKMLWAIIQNFPKTVEFTFYFEGKLYNAFIIEDECHVFQDLADIFEICGSA